MAVREIRGHPEEFYGVAVSPDLMGRVPNAVHEEVRDRQNRPLHAVYAAAFFDALRFKVRNKDLSSNRAVHLARQLPEEATKKCEGCGPNRVEDGFPPLTR